MWFPSPVFHRQCGLCVSRSHSARFQSSVLCVLGPALASLRRPKAPQRSGHCPEPGAAAGPQRQAPPCPVAPCLPVLPPRLQGLAGVAALSVCFCVEVRGGSSPGPSGAGAPRPALRAAVPRRPGVRAAGRGPVGTRRARLWTQASSPRALGSAGWVCGERGLMHRGGWGGVGCVAGRSRAVCGDGVSDAGFVGKPCSGSRFVPGWLRLPSPWPWTTAVPVSCHHLRAGED